MSNPPEIKVRRASIITAILMLVALGAIFVSGNSIQQMQNAQMTEQKAIAGQQTAIADANTVSTRSAQMMASLTPLPSTLTAVAQSVQLSQLQVTNAYQTATAGINSASTAIARSNLTLTPVPLTLTAISVTVDEVDKDTSFALQLAYVSVLLAEDNPVVALQVGDRLVSTYPDEADAYVVRGLIYLDTADNEAAITDFSKALELDPDNGDTYHRRGNAYRIDEQLDKALADLNRAIEINNQNVAFWVLISIALLRSANALSSCLSY
ncbi:MAG: tetratricopeptide repeat protein [Anaerolineae bacterium]|nr:tetratricopeptide repeat protein [Anaerolineae bacterium]